jgi:hypothetical protein
MSEKKTPATYSDPVTQSNYAVWVLVEEAQQVRIQFQGDRPGGFAEELWLPRQYVKKENDWDE